MSADPLGDRDPAVAAAIERSHLRDVPPSALRALLRGARVTVVPAAGTYRHVGEPGPHLELVVDGLVRVYLEAPDGRRLTIRYCRSGALLGAASLYRPGFLMPGSLQALVPSTVVALDPASVRRAADGDTRVARALLAELSERTLAFAAEIGGTAFSSVRQRVCRHLLDLASESQHDAVLVARVSQQELADAVASAREVVVRVLRELRTDGHIDTGRAAIRIRAPEALLEIGSFTGDWNQGS